MTQEQTAQALYLAEMAALPAAFARTMVAWADLPDAERAAWIDRVAAMEAMPAPSMAEVQAFYEEQQASLHPRFRRDAIAWDDLDDATKAAWSDLYAKGRS